MIAVIKALWKDESGQALVEYGLVIGIVCVALVASLIAFRTQLATFWTNLTATFAGAVNGG